MNLLTGASLLALVKSIYYRENRYHSEKETHAAPSVTIKDKHVNNQNP